MQLMKTCTNFWFKSQGIPLFSESLFTFQIVQVILCLQAFYSYFTDSRNTKSLIHKNIENSPVKKDYILMI